MSNHSSGDVYRPGADGLRLRARACAPAVLALALLAACSGTKEAPLQRLDLDPGRTAVVGLSSGAYMATQAHLAYSDRIMGAGVVAGGPYGCAQGDVQTALGPCMSGKPELPDAGRLAGRAHELADAGKLAPLSGLAGDRIYLLHAHNDPLVQPALAQVSATLYEQLAGDGGIAVRLDDQRDFGHMMPTLDHGVECVTGGSPYIGKCGFDAAGEMLAWLYGTPVAQPAAEAGGELHRFDQDAYRVEGEDAMLASTGYVYVPAACAAGDTRCGLLVVFHGCEQNADKVGEAFVRDAGFNPWADAHGLVVLYPQVRVSYMPLNPKGCWDWWGYTGPDYDTRDGAQLRWLAAAAEAIGAPL